MQGKISSFPYLAIHSLLELFLKNKIPSTLLGILIRNTVLNLSTLLLSYKILPLQTHKIVGLLVTTREG